MAIAAIVLHCMGGARELEKALRSLPETIDARLVDEGKIAATLECPAPGMTACLRKAAALPDVWNLELVYVNYEDDLEAGGPLAPPPDSR